MTHYPLFVALEDEPVVVVGGGPVATRKVRGLLIAGVALTVISPKVTPALRKLARSKQIVWRRRRYRSGDLRGARLVYAATNDETVNQQVCQEARRRRQWVNCATPPEAGNCLVPSVIRRGMLTVAISTAGASPALAKSLREALEQYLDAGYAGVAEKMQDMRRTVAREVRSAKERRARYRRALQRWLKKV